MPGTPADLASRSLLIGKTLLGGSTYENPLLSRSLVLSRVNLLGQITSKAYPLASRGIVIERVPAIGRRTTGVNIHLSRNLVIERTMLGGIATGSRSYPAIVPSAVQFKAPKHMVTEHKVQSGEVETHLWADSDAGATLSLDYTNIADAVADTVMGVWDSVYGTYRHLQLAQTVLKGVKEDLAQYMLRGGKAAKWFFAEAPKWEGRLKGYGDLKVSLVSKHLATGSVIGGNAPFLPVPVVSESSVSYGSCDSPETLPDADFLAISFGGFLSEYSVIVDKNLPSAFMLDPPASTHEVWTTQDNKTIVAWRVTAQPFRVIIGNGEPGMPRVISMVGTITWTGGPLNKAFNASLDYGVTRNLELHRSSVTSSNVTIVAGATCFNLATLVCTTPPFTGETYGQAVISYKTTTVAAFGSYVGNQSGIQNIGDGYEGMYPLVPPLPDKLYYNSYVNDAGGTVSTIPLFTATRSKTVLLVPVSSVKTLLARIGVNRFRLYMDQQAVGGLMVLRYNQPLDQPDITGGFAGPTMVTIPYNARQADFDVSPGTVGSYTVTLEKCYGLESQQPTAQFWPLERDPINYIATGP